MFGPSPQPSPPRTGEIGNTITEFLLILKIAMPLIPSANFVSVPRWSLTRLALHLGVSVLLWSIIAAACMCVGSTRDIGWPFDASTRQFRLEVVLIASTVGACLAAAGVVYQAILRNPLADPYLLGVSTGASLCAYAWRLPLAGAVARSLFAALSQGAFAFIGAVTVVCIVLLLATRNGRLQPITLLLVGVIMNSILGAVFLLLNSLFPGMAAGLGGATGFLVGAIQTNLTRVQEVLAATVALVGWIVLLYLAGQLNIATLAEVEAESLGINIHRLRWIALIVASIITSAAVSISGSIGFVGLICPHVARRLVGVDHRRLLPISTALGAALLCSADAVSRLLSSHGWLGTQLPVGVLTALLGGPFFLFLLWENRAARD